MTPLKTILILFIVLESSLPLSSSAQEAVGKLDEKQLEEKIVQRSPVVSSPKGIDSKDLEVARINDEWRKTQLRNKFQLEILLSAVAVVSLAIVLYFMTRKEIKPAASEILLGTGLIFVIFGTMFIVVVADRDEQLTASTGILGAIAGYLFGRRTATDTPGGPPPPGGGPPGPGGPPPPGPGGPA